MQNFVLLSSKLSELCSILFYGSHFVFYSLNGCGWSRSTCMQNFRLLASKLSELCSISFYGGHFFGGHFVFDFLTKLIDLAANLFFSGHFVFYFWLRVVKIYFHAKFRPSSSKIERVMLNLVFCTRTVPVPYHTCDQPTCKVMCFAPANNSW